MKSVHISSPEIVIEYVVNTLIQHLERGESVVWLLAGGSTIALEVEVAKKLAQHDTSRLSTLLADERYGPPGRADENYTQLINAGFTLPIERILSGVSAEETAAAFGVRVEQLLGKADFSLGVFGIGTDGHTAGIKPRSPSVTSREPAIFYEWDDYERITITPQVIRQLDEAVIYAVGSEKLSTLQTLMNETVPLEIQPAQVLKDIKTATLYTDNTL